MSDLQKVHIIGIGDDGLDGLTASARSLIEQANVVIGSEKSLKLLHGPASRRIPVGTDLTIISDHIRRMKERVF